MKSSRIVFRQTWFWGLEFVIWWAFKASLIFSSIVLHLTSYICLEFVIWWAFIASLIFSAIVLHLCCGKKLCGSMFCQRRLYCLKVTPTPATLLLEILPSRTNFCTAWILIMGSYQVEEDQQQRNISCDVIIRRKGVNHRLFYYFLSGIIRLHSRKALWLKFTVWLWQWTTWYLKFYLHEF